LSQYQPLSDLLFEEDQALVSLLCDTTDLCDGDKVFTFYLLFIYC